MAPQMDEPAPPVRAPSSTRFSRSIPNLPDHLKHGPDEDEDITQAVGSAKEQFMHQSIFSMITAAGHRSKRTDFTSRFDEDFSESDEEDGPSTDPKLQSGRTSVKTPIRMTSGATEPERLGDDVRGRAQKEQSSRASIHSKRAAADYMSESQMLPYRSYGTNSPYASTPEQTSAFEAPILSRMVTARAELGKAEKNDNMSTSAEDATEGLTACTTPLDLASQLQKIFSFEEAEGVIAEYPCWLLQTVLLQGYLYVTEKHVCFYALIPKKEKSVSKSGYLAKQRNTGPNPLYRRYWFQLKGDVLSYYSNPAEPYFPAGHIDLRYAISARATDGKDGTHFYVDTAKKTFRFRAENVASAREWIKNLQRVMFQNRNEGDTVKVSIPIDSILEVDRTTALDFADTIKLQYIDNEETFVLDEQLFSFFSHGQEAYALLQKLAAENDFHKPPLPVEQNIDQPDADSVGAVKQRSPGQQDCDEDSGGSAYKSDLDPGFTRADTSGMTSFAPRPSRVEKSAGENDRGRTVETSPKISEHNRAAEHSSISSTRQESAESFAQETESSEAVHSLDETDISASQMLEASTLFQPSAMRRNPRSGSHSFIDDRRNSEGTNRSNGDSDQGNIKKSGGGSALLPGQSTINLQKGESQGNAGLHQRQAARRTAYRLGSFGQAGVSLGLANQITEYMRKRSKDMSSLLATETMGYYEKVSGMWAGQRKHYGSNQGLVADDEVDEADDEDTTANDELRFRGHFGLPTTEQLRATYYAHVHRVLPLYGKIYVSNKHFCFRALMPGTRFKVVLPFTAIENASKERTYRPRYHAFMIVIRGFEELFFDMRSREDRDDCVVNLLQLLEHCRSLDDGKTSRIDADERADAATAEHFALEQARKAEHPEDMTDPHQEVSIDENDTSVPAVVFDDPRASIINFKPGGSLRITCLTIGSRGDVQPYIALCKGLLAEGHRPSIATHPEFEDWIRHHGIGFQPVAGDPAELMRICVENGMFTLSFLKEASAKFRGWIDELLTTAWEACQESDLLIESPSAMGGIHIAQALQIPYFRAFSMPWTRTRAYPHAFAVPERKMGGYYNYMSYVMFDQIFWKAIAGQVNRWRKKELKLGPTSLDVMQPNKVPFLYSFSPSVVVPPLDYSDWIRVTGYWFLDEGADWTPPEDLQNFIAKARQDGKKLVYIGFGSIVVENPAGLTKTVVEAVLKADVRCVLSKGWSDRLGKKDATAVEVTLPPEILQIQAAPHDWLFKRMDAAAHHGGAGTTGASLRAGIPTIIKPFFGDQFFFGSRVDDLGVGICMKKVNTTLFSQALWHASHDGRMKAKAAALGEQIRKENGVGNAIQALYRDMEYAKTLVERRGRPAQAESGAVALDDGPMEETWTFVGDDSDPEYKKSEAGVKSGGAEDVDDDDART